LIGDFAFALWDGPRQRLFCAVDHLGVKPLFYAVVNRTFVFSNTLECVRLHPGVSQPDGNDLADWAFEFDDAFGFGGGGLPNTLSATDLRVLDVLGWTPSGAASPSRDGGR
jgi:asparagine synthetase B (glutamine-hydrolysing)